ncbi:MAG: ATP-dependent helicase [Candidatus Magasanikbacteria bacterium]|nr:ATP-dependent helicase [Candidatus Magasanikbacteria bacterium]
MIDFQKELNTEQLDIILHGNGPCLVLAGAGSGKTRTITYRVAYLLEQGVKPENILLVTFTNKASREMLERVSKITEGKVQLLWSGTFHHIGYRILKKYAPVLGYNNNFTVLDSEDSRDLIKICIKQETGDFTGKRFPSPQVVQSMISYARNAQMTIADVIDLQHDSWAHVTEIIERIANEYAKRKRISNVMDFDDLLVNVQVLLEKSREVQEKYARQFEYIMVDEYQDTNNVQAKIIDLLASVHKNILVVGDDAQSIYSFRAADIGHILEFEHTYPHPQIFKLETNYRSIPEILDVANQVIAQNTKQYKKELRAVLESFAKPEVHAFADAYEEGRFIVGRIEELLAEGVALKKIAVLFRAAFHSQALEMELSKRGIAYEYRGGIRFFERAHVKDILAYLKIFNNKNDQISWNRILNMQTGIGPAAAGKIYSLVQAPNTPQPPSRGENQSDSPFTSPLEGGRGVFQPVHTHLTLEQLSDISSSLTPKAQIGWNDFLQIYSVLKIEDKKNPGQLISAITTSKYRDYLEQEYPDYRERLQDLEQLSVFASQYVVENEEDEPLTRFLAEATLQEQYTTEQENSSKEKMILSTVHQAKGLEWEAVFVINVSAGQFPSERSRGDEIEEERRLFYVAITRAQKYLYVTYPLVSNKYSMLQGPSMFIEEIDRDLLDMHGSFDSGTSSFFDPSDDVDDIKYVSEDEEDPWAKKKRSFLKDLGDL